MTTKTTPYQKWTLEQLDDAIFDHSCARETEGKCICTEWEAEITNRYKKEREVKQIYTDLYKYAESEIEPELEETT